MDGKLMIFSLSLFMMTLTLVWGLRLVLRVLTAPRADGDCLLRNALSEKGPGAEAPGSFSRIAGAFGMTGLAAVTIGIGYWLVFALFYEPAALPRLGEATAYFAAGGALFAPYAVNRLAGAFRIGD